MTTHNEPSIARRPFLRGAGVTLATLGGMTGSAVAGGHGDGNGGKQPLNDRPADMMLYWSMPADPAEDEPKTPGDFGYPNTFGATAPGGLFLPIHDPSPGGMFDFSGIEMTPNGGALQNSWTFFHGLLLASKPKRYSLVHQGHGIYRSKGQVMRFEAQEPDGRITSQNDIDFLRYPQGFPDPRLAGELFPPVKVLAGNTWRAVGTEQAVLEADNDGNPTPNPSYAATRIDFYTPRKSEYVLSMLYLIWYSDSGEVDPIPGFGPVPPVPGDVDSLATELITGGRLNPGGR